MQNNILIVLGKVVEKTIRDHNQTYGRRLSTMLSRYVVLLDESFGKADTPAQRQAKLRQTQIDRGERHQRVSPHGLEMLRAMMADPLIVSKGFTEVEKEYMSRYTTVTDASALKLIRLARKTVTENVGLVTVDLNGTLHTIERGESQ